MTLQKLQTKLKTHEPRLLTCQEAGMSEGPWYNGELLVAYDGKKTSVMAGEDLVCYAANPVNMRFIAATNGERPWAEGRWNSYILSINTYNVLKEAEENFDILSQKHLDNALEILLALDEAGRLGWTAKSTQPEGSVLKTLQNCFVLALALSDVAKADAAANKRRAQALKWFGGLLRRQRNLFCVSLRYMAKDCGCSAMFLSDVERGNRKPNQKIVTAYIEMKGRF